MWFIFYVYALGICYGETRILWWFNLVMGFSIFILVIIYGLGSIPFANFHDNAPLYSYNTTTNAKIDDATPYTSESLWFQGGMAGFISTLAYTTWAYGGIESTCLLTSYTSNPKTVIPRGIMIGVLTLFACNMIIIFVSASMPGGLLNMSTLDFPMSVAYQLMFKCSENAASSLVIPANFMMGFGFILPSATLCNELAQSNLIPSFLHLKDQKSNFRAMVLCSLLSYVFIIIGFVYEDFGTALNNIAILAGFFTYLMILASYARLVITFSTIERDKWNWTGLVGAAFASIIFILGCVSVAFYQNDNYEALIAFLCIWALLTGYYLFVRKSQTLSEDEKNTIFRLHVIINSNKKSKRRKLKKGRSGRRGSNGSSYESMSNLVSSSVHLFTSSSGNSKRIVPIGRRNSSVDNSHRDSIPSSMVSNRIIFF